MDQFEAFEVLSREVAAGRAVVDELGLVLDRLAEHLAAATSAFEALHARDASDGWEGAWADYGLRDLFDALEEISERVAATLA